MKLMPKFDLTLSAATLLLLHCLLCWSCIRAERDFNFNDSQVPLLEPRDEPLHTHYNQDPYAVEISRCHAADSEVILSLVLKSHDWDELSDNKKAKVLEKLSKFFAISKEFIVMESVTKYDLSEMLKESIRKGNNKCHNSNRRLGRVSFVVRKKLSEIQKECNCALVKLGCGANYFTISEPITKQIGAQVKDGSLDNITGEKFGWWVIWRKHFKTRALRNRRQVEGSGEDDFDDDDYEYGDDEEDVVGTVTEVPAVTTHAHRHHHGVAQPELTENMLESDNHGLSAAAGEQTSAAATASGKDNANDKSADSGLLLLNKNGNIDEEIVESVSQLESVITKTIENTKNIKDLPVVVAEEVEEEGEDVPVAVEIVKELEAPNALEELDRELESKTAGANAHQLTLATAAAATATATTTAPLRATHTSGITKKTQNLIDDNDDNDDDADDDADLDADVDVDAGEGSGALEPSAPLNRNNVNGDVSARVDDINSLASASVSASASASSSANVAEVIESTSTTTADAAAAAAVPPTSSQPAAVAVGLDSMLSAISSTTITTASTAHSSATTVSPAFEPLAVNASTSLSPQTPNSALDASSVSVSSPTSHSATAYSPSLSSPPLSSSSSSPSSSSSLSPSTSTTVTPATTTSATTLPTKQQQQQPEQQQKSYSAAAMSTTLPNSNSEDVAVSAVDFASIPPTTTTTTTITATSAATNFKMPTSITTTITTNTTDTTTTYMLNVLTTPITTTTTSITTQHTGSDNAAYEMAIATTTTTPPQSAVHVNSNGKKDANETSTVSPPDSQNTNATTQHTTPEVMDVYGAAGGASSPTSPSTSSTSPTSSASTPTSTSTTTDGTSPTTSTADYVEPKLENSPPLINSRLQKLAVTSGKSFTFTVPQDTFFDAEDLTNLRLELTDKDGHELKPSSWLQFNPETRVISGLPLDDAVSKWQYHLSATDSGNESVTETLELTVQQHRGVRTVNHEVNIAVKLNEKNMPSIVWQLKLMRAIATTLGDDNTNSIVVREIRQMSQDPNFATFVYFNETLLTSECPESELNNLVKRLDANRLSDLVRPMLGIKSITGQLIGPCQKTHVTKPKPTINMSNNISPIPRNQVDRVNATIGHLLVYKVPSDTFYDPNDNEPLTLTLKTKDHKELNPRHWLQFDSKNQEFYGIPKSADIGSEEYLLVAEDAGGLTATDALVVVVSHAPKKEFSVYFKAYLAIRHEQFNADLQRKFVERISQLFGDSSTEYVQIRSVTTHHDSDGTIVNFYNTTLFKSHNRCPEEEIEAVRSVYLIKDYLLRDNVQKALGPELNLTNVQAMPLGICHPQTDVTHHEFVPTKTEEPTLKSTFGEEYMYTVILPAVIIVVMIVIGLSIACCLHRRRHKSGKMELGDEEERKSFRTKGIPVIFQDELDEKPEIGNKSPIILKDEKPPLLPPSYNTSNMNGDNDVDEYVPPPAVVVGGREVRGKSPATPSYRKPPPYVSP